MDFFDDPNPIYAGEDAADGLAAVPAANDDDDEDVADVVDADDVIPLEDANDEDTDM